MKRIVMIALLTSLVGAVFAAPPNGRKPLTPAERQQRAAEAAKRKQQFLARVAEKPSAKATVAKVFEKDGKKLLYRFHAPKVLKPGEKYPLVILMHGAGERGTNNVAQLVWGGQPIADWFQKKGAEFYFIAGQVPSGAQWVNVPWTSYEHSMPAEPSKSMYFSTAASRTAICSSVRDQSKVAQFSCASWTLRTPQRAVET